MNRQGTKRHSKVARTVNIRPFLCGQVVRLWLIGRYAAVLPALIGALYLQAGSQVKPKDQPSNRTAPNNQTVKKEPSKKRSGKWRRINSAPANLPPPAPQNPNEPIKGVVAPKNGPQAIIDAGNTSGNPSTNLVKGANDPPPDAGYYRNSGERSLNEKKYVEAETAFENSVRLEPENPIHHYLLGKALAAQDKYVPAEKSYIKAIELDRNNNPDYLFDLGLLLERQGRYEEAKVKYNVLVNLFPSNDEYKKRLSSCFFNIGRNLYLKKSYNKAEAEFELALKFEPDNASYQHYMGVCLYEQYKNERAEGAFETAIKIACLKDPEEPVCAETHARFSLLLYRIDRFEEAEAEMSHAVQLKPQNIDYQNYLGVLLTSRREYPDAEKKFRNAIKLAEELKAKGNSNEVEMSMIQSYYHLGELYLKQKDVKMAMSAHENARERIERLSKTYPDNADYHYYNGLTLTSLGNCKVADPKQGDKSRTAEKYFNLAEGKFQEAIKIQRNNASYHHGLGELFRSQGIPKFKEVELILLKGGPLNTFVELNMGSGRKKYLEAEKALMEAVKCAPNNAEYQYHLGSVLMDLAIEIINGRVSYNSDYGIRAESALQEAVKGRPGNAEFNFKYGFFLLERKQKGSCGYIRKALDLDKHNQVLDRASESYKRAASLCN